MNLDVEADGEQRRPLASMPETTQAFGSPLLMLNLVYAEISVVSQLIVAHTPQSLSISRLIGSPELVKRNRARLLLTYHDVTWPFAILDRAIYLSLDFGCQSLRAWRDVRVKEARLPLSDSAPNPCRTSGQSYQLEHGLTYIFSLP